MQRRHAIRLAAAMALPAALGLASGCATRRAAPAAQGPTLRRVAAVEEDVHVPAVGATATAAVGDSIVSHYRQRRQDVLRLGQALTLRTGYLPDPRYTYEISVPAGDYPAFAADANGARYYALGRWPLVWIYQGKTSHSELAAIVIKVDSAGAASLLWTLYDDPERTAVPVALEGAQQTTITEPAPSVDGFRRELIYTGRSGSTLTLLYREFINDMARPAFSQALQYDIGADSIVGYRGARFRVLAADNAGITYEVLAPLPPR